MKLSRYLSIVVVALASSLNVQAIAQSVELVPLSEVDSVDSVIALNEKVYFSRISTGGGNPLFEYNPTTQVVRGIKLPAGTWTDVSAIDLAVDGDTLLIVGRYRDASSTTFDGLAIWTLTPDAEIATLAVDLGKVVSEYGPFEPFRNIFSTSRLWAISIADVGSPESPGPRFIVYDKASGSVIYVPGAIEAARYKDELYFVYHEFLGGCQLRRLDKDNLESEDIKFLGALLIESGLGGQGCSSELDVIGGKLLVALQHDILQGTDNPDVYVCSVWASDGTPAGTHELVTVVGTCTLPVPRLGGYSIYDTGFNFGIPSPGQRVISTDLTPGGTVETNEVLPNPTIFGRKPIPKLVTREFEAPMGD